jgi:chromosome segregation ATPase
MAARKKNTVHTPLHLLQQLSSSLLEHLEAACAQAQIDAEKLLAKLEKQRGKAQEKLHDARLKLEDAAANGKAKAQARTHKRIEELEELFDSLQQRQNETRAYIAQLQADAEESLKLAQGIGKVKEAATQALAKREAAATRQTTAAAPRSRTAVARKPAGATSKAKSIAAAATPAIAKSTTPAKPAKPATARKPAAKPTASRKPVARKAATASAAPVSDA